MKTLQLQKPAPVEKSPLCAVDVPHPIPGNGELLIRVDVCGICHTDLHVVEGDLQLPKLPLTPGHQVVGIVEAVGPGVTKYGKGDRLGIPWLFATCGGCTFCTSGRENLCDQARFTGYHVDGGYAEEILVPQDSAYPVPAVFGGLEAAPLLCAGVIGYRALRLSEIRPGQRAGLYGFGASAHVAIQILKHWGCEVYVFTRSSHHRELAEELGASWTGAAGERAPHPVESAVIFAPAGELIPPALRALAKGGTLVLAGIHMSPIPSFEYPLLYEERTIRSVANSTRADVTGLLEVAAAIPVRTEVEAFPLRSANEALQKLKRSEIRGSGALVIRE